MNLLRVFEKHPEVGVAVLVGATFVAMWVMGRIVG